MDSLDYWRLCSELNVIQAALLVAGEDPSVTGAYVENWEVEKRPKGYEAAKAAISNALRRNHIEGTLVPIFEYDINGSQCGEIENSIDIRESMVLVSSLRDWLVSRGFTTGFFFQGEVAAPTYLDSSHSRYAPKLAAAVRAWEAMGDTTQLSGKSPKQALMKWLRENAPAFQLTDSEGRPNEQGIEDIAKVANWQPLGGAPKTPAG